MAQPQDILSPITDAAIFLTVVVEPGGEGTAKELLADVPGLKRSVGFRIPEGGLACVAGIGSDLWDRMLGSPKPAGLHPFIELTGLTHSAPSTPGDLFFHIRATRMDMCFELARLLTDRLGEHARVIDEVHGFKSFDERDLLGFVDGTENPEPYEAPDAVLIGEEEPEFEGGSYLIVQKYLHDLGAWNQLTIEEQERAIGRTKMDDVEFPDEDKPSNSHLVLNVIEDENGDERDIMRFNMPFGRVGESEFGTYFIGYAADVDVTETMLRRMFIGVPEGNHDRILDFSTAITGSNFFVPSAEFLDGIDDGDDESGQVAEQEEPIPGPTPADGSLGIGDARQGLSDSPPAG